MKVAARQHPPFRVREIRLRCGESLDLARDSPLADPYLSVLVIPLTVFRRQSGLVTSPPDFPTHCVDVDQ